MALQCPSAHARKVLTNLDIDRDRDFDLARDIAIRAQASGETATARGVRPGYPKEKLGPHWSFQPLDDGPQIEMGALGGGRKGMPKIAHVGLNWDF
ncbi:hypothetical protein [Novosphingobium album (ex Liu et al. 2023)]|uniref:hypothetical protein n=1 Tax=Novosphingobium album (ex Liu et al. 2023) TaxID=3031130 RepID=UPI0023AF0019|nr:hypothetical protein [Novosphingobium album (ex Liu et al. 2023)]